MAILVSAKGVQKSFGARPLFDDITFVIAEGERVGLIGPNGAGKSTLLNILAGEVQADAGSVSYQKGLKLGFLHQTPQLPVGKTVAEIVEGHSISGEILSKLELAPFQDRIVDTLSGGWKKRVALARELVGEPDLLLLDEPTNHLDIESILWLESFLQRASFSSVVVTHDRYFLQRVTNRILELDRRNPKGLLSVSGDYSQYLLRKEELLNTQQQKETVLRNTLRREVEWLRRGAKARTTKQQARIKAAEYLMDEVEELRERNISRSVDIEFQSFEKKPKRLLEAKKISKSFGDKILFKNLDLLIGPRSRIGLLGTNGSGKSTLIRVLCGDDKLDSGHIFRADALKIAYFEQNRESLDPLRSLQKTICPYGDHVNYRGTMIHVNGYLDRFLFRKEQFDVPVGKLSGGEQSRVLIAQLMLKEANLLVLDEPTNDLDVETLDILQTCLTEFEGGLLLVTHDRYFLDQVASQIIVFPTAPEEAGNLLDFAGLDQWEKWRQGRQEKPRAASSKVLSAAALAAAPEKKRKLSFNEARELSTMESHIQKAETRLAELEGLSQQNQSNAKKLTEICQEIAQTQTEIDCLYARWAELEAKK